MLRHVQAFAAQSSGRVGGSSFRSSRAAPAQTQSRTVVRARPSPSALRYEVATQARDRTPVARSAGEQHHHRDPWLRAAGVRRLLQPVRLLLHADLLLPGEGLPAAVCLLLLCPMPAAD